MDLFTFRFMGILRADSCILWVQILKIGCVVIAFLLITYDYIRYMLAIKGCTVNASEYAILFEALS